MSMIREFIYNRLSAIIVEHLGVQPDDVSMDKRFDEDFGADSLDKVELIIAIEDEFGLSDLDEEARDRVITVQDAVVMIENAEKRENANV